MKKVFRLVALAGAMVLAACSSDEITAPPKVVTPDMVNSYVNIRICTPGVGGTRAPGDGDGNYEYGEAYENNVNRYLLLFYDAQGNLVGVSEKGLGPDTHQTTPGQNVAVIKSGTAEVTLTEGSQMPTQLVAVINANGDMRDALLDTDLSGVSKIVIGEAGLGDSKVEDLWDVDGKGEPGFVMNNSVYYENGTTLVMSTPIAGMLYSNKKEAEDALQEALNGDTEAKAKLVDVYVERLAVKGRILTSTIDVTPIVVTDIEGNEYNLTFNVDLFDVTATAPSSYFVKQLREIGVYSDPFKTWMNAYNDFRSYWAQSYYALDSYTKSENFPVVGDHEDKYILHYKSTDEVLGENEFAGKKTGKTLGSHVYFAENTFRGSRLQDQTMEDNPYVVATSFLLNGHYTVTAKGEGNASKYDGKDFYLSSYYEALTGNTLYRIFDAEDAIETYAKIIKDYKIVATSANGELDTKKLGLVHKATFFDAAGQEQENNPANRVTIALVDTEGEILTDPTGIYVYTESTNDDGTVIGTWSEANEADLQAINADIEKRIVGTMMMYNTARAFFYIPIKHYTANMDDATANFPAIGSLKTGNIGVVRNHVYSMTINSITGLGIGVGPDPSVPELPDPKPVQNYYINAKLNVLQWHVMGQSVDL